ncbi:MAG: ABC transporter substrate-binding protein [Candidatus Sulfotelmatobacter sp.]
MSDPVGEGIVASFARPGNNFTGFTNFEDTMGGKWLEILKELVPTLTRVGFLFNPATAPGGGKYFLQSFEVAAPSFQVQSILSPVADELEVERTLRALAAGGNAGLIVNSDGFTSRHRTTIIAAAVRHRLPAIYPFLYFAADGGLIAYGTDIKDLWRRAALYIDRILRGEKAGDLAVQAPTKFELAINLNAARALGLEVPSTLLARADVVIE